MSKSPRSPGSVSFAAQRQPTKPRPDSAPPRAAESFDNSPLHPRPLLMKVLGLILVLWVAILLAMYFLTVYRAR
jgi:hypothetical protein